MNQFVPLNEAVAALAATLKPDDALDAVVEKKLETGEIQGVVTRVEPVPAPADDIDINPLVNVPRPGGTAGQAPGRLCSRMFDVTRPEGWKKSRRPASTGVIASPLNSSSWLRAWCAMSPASNARRACSIPS